jgi:hypothetical protein
MRASVNIFRGILNLPKKFRGQSYNFDNGLDKKLTEHTKLMLPNIGFQDTPFFLHKCTKSAKACVAQNFGPSFKHH